MSKNDELRKLTKKPKWFDKVDYSIAETFTAYQWSEILLLKKKSYLQKKFIVYEFYENKWDRVALPILFKGFDDELSRLLNLTLEKIKGHPEPYHRLGEIKDKSALAMSIDSLENLVTNSEVDYKYTEFIAINILHDIKAIERDIRVIYKNVREKYGLNNKLSQEKLNSLSKNRYLQIMDLEIYSMLTNKRLTSRYIQDWIHGDSIEPFSDVVINNRRNYIKNTLFSEEYMLNLHFQQNLVNN